MYLELSQLQETLGSRERELEKANKVSKLLHHHLSVKSFWLRTAGFTEKQES